MQTFEKGCSFLTIPEPCANHSHFNQKKRKTEMDAFAIIPVPYHTIMMGVGIDIRGVLLYHSSGKSGLHFIRPSLKMGWSRRCVRSGGRSLILCLVGGRGARARKVIKVIIYPLSAPWR